MSKSIKTSSNQGIFYQHLFTMMGIKSSYESEIQSGFKIPKRLDSQATDKEMTYQSPIKFIKEEVIILKFGRKIELKKDEDSSPESSTGDTGYDSCDYIELGVPVMSIVSIASSGKPFSTMAHLSSFKEGKFSLEELDLDILVIDIDDEDFLPLPEELSPAPSTVLL